MVRKQIEIGRNPRPIRIDSYLKYVCLIKSREKAKEACNKGYIKLNEHKCKPASKVKIGDEIRLEFPDSIMKIKVVDIPQKQVSRKIAKKFYQVLESHRIELETISLIDELIEEIERKRKEVLKNEGF